MRDSLKKVSAKKQRDRLSLRTLYWRICTGGKINSMTAAATAAGIYVQYPDVSATVLMSDLTTSNSVVKYPYYTRAQLLWQNAQTNAWFIAREMAINLANVESLLPCST